MKFLNAFLMSALAGAFLLAAGCTRHLPLDAVTELIPIKGQLTVFVQNGGAQVGGQSVTVVGPNEASQVQLTAVSNTAGLSTGEAVFSVPYSGTYKVYLTPQSGLTPLIQTVSLTSEQPYGTTTLQLLATYLLVTPSDGKPLSYDDTQCYHTFKLTAESTSLSITVNVFYNAGATTLPTGWQVEMSPASLEAGQSTDLVVETTPYTVFGNVTITVSAITSASISLAVAPIVLTRSWNPELQVTSNITFTSGSGYLYQTDTLNCVNCVNPSGLTAYIDTQQITNGTVETSSAYGPADTTLTAGSTWEPYDGQNTSPQQRCACEAGTTVTQQYEFTVGAYTSNMTSPIIWTGQTYPYSTSYTLDW